MFVLGGNLEGREQGNLVGRGVESWMGRDAGTREGCDVRCPSREVHGITWTGKDGGRRARCPAKGGHPAGTNRGVLREHSLKRGARREAGWEAELPG